MSAKAWGATCDCPDQIALVSIDPPKAQDSACDVGQIDSYDRFVEDSAAVRRRKQGNHTLELWHSSVTTFGAT